MINTKTAIGHVVFDNDGTIINSEERFLQNQCKVLPSYIGYKITYDSLKEKYIPSWYELLEALGHKSPSKKIINQIVREINTLNENYIDPLYPGIKTLISRLHKNNIATYIWTGRDRESAITLFEKHNIKDLFSDMMFMDTCIPKPNEDGLNRMLNGIAKSKIIMIGDSLTDLIGANNYGINCFIVDWHNKGKQKEFYNEGAELVTSDIDELYNNLIDRLISRR